MKIQVDVDIPDEIIQKTARTAIAECFTGSLHSAHAGAGYDAIRNAVNDYVKGIDWAPDIKSEASRQSAEIVRDVTGNVIRAMVKAQVKAMKEAGELL